MSQAENAPQTNEHIVAVVYHSGYGHTERQAQAVADGAAALPATRGVLVNVETMNDETWLQLDNADAIVFGSPTYMGTVSAPFKQFMDDSSQRWLKQGWRNKVAAGFTNSGSYSGDKLQTLTTLVVFACQHSMFWVGSDIMPPSPEDGLSTTPEQLNRMGSFLGAMAQSGNAPPEETPSAGDLATANALGKRVATLVVKLAD